MASYYEAIREFRELTQQRERETLDARGEHRLQMLADWIDAGATTDPPEITPEPPEQPPLPTGTDRFAASHEEQQDTTGEESEEPLVREPTLRMLRDRPVTLDEEPAPVEVSAGPRSNEWLASPADSRPHLLSSPAGAPAEEEIRDLLSAPAAEHFDLAEAPAAPSVAPAISHPDWFADVQWDERPAEQPLVISAAVPWESPPEISAPPLVHVEEELSDLQQESSWGPLTAAEPAQPQLSDWDLPAEDAAPLLVAAAPEEDPLAEPEGAPVQHSRTELTADLPEAEALLVDAAEEDPLGAKPEGWPPSPGEWSPIALVPLSEAEKSPFLDLPAGGTPAPTAGWSLPTIPIYRPGAGGAPVVGSAAPAPVAAAPALVLHGEHRVALHTIEGQVKRGVASDIDLSADSLLLAAGAGGAPERIPFSRAKALFFLLQPGEKPPASSGKRVQVTFADGRKVEGHLEDDVGPGFFLVPADARTNTARMYVLHHAVRSVTP